MRFKGLELRKAYKVHIPNHSNCLKRGAKNMKAKIMGALFAVLALVMLAGCTETFTPEEVNVMLEEHGVELTDSFQTQYDAALAGQDELRGQLTELTANLETEKANSGKVTELETLIAELQANLDAAEEVTETAAAEEVAIEDGVYFLVEDIALNGNFECLNGIDNDDLQILKYSDVEYDDETIDFEEKLYFSEHFAPVLNVDDFGAEVLVGMADDGAIKYVLEFDTPIVFVADEELEIDFLGVPYTLVSYIAGELTYRVSEEYEGGYGDEWTIDGQLVKVMEVDGDSDKVRIQVGDESEVIKLGKQKEINGLTVYVDDVFTATIPEDVAWVSLYIGEDITQEVTDGDEFNELEDWEWVIEDKNTNDLTKIGVVYVEDISDDKDLWHIEDGICLPLDYICVEFQEVKNAEVTDIKFDISNTKLKVTFDGKLEIDGKRIDDGKFTVVDLGTFDYEYYYKGDKKESTVEGFDFTDIKFFVEDRMLNFKMTEEIGVLEMTTKNVDYGESPWVANDNAGATIEYSLTGNEFNWGLLDSEGFEIVDYTLIYYKDNSNRWDSPAAAIPVDSLTSDLPYNDDGNVDEYNYCEGGSEGEDYAHCHGAKLWLVPSECLSGTVISWEASCTERYLFETDLITYSDIESGLVTIYDKAMDYVFYWEPGEFISSDPAKDAADMNDDEDYRMPNGDVLYSSEVNDAADEEDTVEIGLVSDEALEVILKIQ